MFEISFFLSLPLCVCLCGREKKKYKKNKNSFKNCGFSFTFENVTQRNNIKSERKKDIEENRKNTKTKWTLSNDYNEKWTKTDELKLTLSLSPSLFLTMFIILLKVDIYRFYKRSTFCGGQLLIIVIHMKAEREKKHGRSRRSMKMHRSKPREREKEKHAKGRNTHNNTTSFFFYFLSLSHTHLNNRNKKAEQFPKQVFQTCMFQWMQTSAK